MMGYYFRAFIPPNLNKRKDAGPYEWLGVSGADSIPSYPELLPQASEDLEHNWGLPTRPFFS